MGRRAPNLGPDHETFPKHSTTSCGNIGMVPKDQETGASPPRDPDRAPPTPRNRSGSLISPLTNVQQQPARTRPRTRGSLPMKVMTASPDFRYPARPRTGGVDGTPGLFAHTSFSRT